MATSGRHTTTRETRRTRVLIVATEAVVGDGIAEVLEPRLRGHGHGDEPGQPASPGGREAEAFVVAPAITGNALKHAMGDVDEARVAAQERLDDSLETLRGQGLDVTGAVGDSDPILAIQDALATFDADEIVLVTRPEDEARWLEGDVFERARVQFEPEIVHVSLAPAGAGTGSRVADVETAEAGFDEPPDAEVDPRSRNMPKLSIRDLAGIAVAIIGSVILVAIAGTCEEEDVQRVGGADGAGTDGNCVAIYIIAGVTVLINLAHVVGLLLFQSVRYRGIWERAFANMSLIGTPLAVVAALILR